MHVGHCMLAVAVGLAAFGPASDGSARTRKHHAAVIEPSADAVELGTIAPPTRRETLEQTYGDAAIARSRFQPDARRDRAADDIAAQRTGVPYPCDPRRAEASAYVCDKDPRVTGYGQAYAINPAYVSSPQIFRQDPSVQAPIMPQVTSLFYGLNRLENGSRD